jgi:catalase
VNAPHHAKVATNQRDGQMTYQQDQGGVNPHVNYEPSITGGLREGQYPTHDDQGPEIAGRLTRKRIPLTADYLQAGQRYLLMEEWERDDLVANFVSLISEAACRSAWSGTSSSWRTTWAGAWARASGSRWTR